MGLVFVTEEYVKIFRSVVKVDYKMRTHEYDWNYYSNKE